MRKAAPVILAIVLSLLFPLSPVKDARAAEAGPFYLGVLGAYLVPEKAKVEEGAKIDLDNSWMLGLKFGYIVPTFKYVALEVEYDHFFKTDAERQRLETIGADYLDLVGGELTADNLFLNILLRYPEGNLNPYLGFGLGWSWAKFKGSTFENVGGATQTLSFDEKDNAFAWQILAGLNYQINKQWSAGLGYRYFQSKPKFADSEFTYRTHMITLGASFHF